MLTVTVVEAVAEGVGITITGMVEEVLEDATTMMDVVNVVDEDMVALAAAFERALERTELALAAKAVEAVEALEAADAVEAVEAVVALEAADAVEAAEAVEAALEAAADAVEAVEALEALEALEAEEAPFEDPAGTGTGTGTIMGTEAEVPVLEAAVVNVTIAAGEVTVVTVVTEVAEDAAALKM